MLLVKHLRRARIATGDLRRFRTAPLRYPCVVSSIRRYGTQDVVNPVGGAPSPSQDFADQGGRRDDNKKGDSTYFKMFEAAATTCASIVVLGYVINLGFLFDL
jgi:hypothetical protein